MVTRLDIENSIKKLLVKYNAEYALLFGSYARNEETNDSDVDVVVFGGASFKKTNIFAFAEDLRTLTGKKVDAFEISELNQSSSIYNTILREGIKIA